MGIDIMGRTVSFPWWAWRMAYDAGLASGWEPVGTEPPPNWDGDWNGSYFTNALQVVTEHDARAWAKAVRKTCDAMAGECEPTDQQAAFIAEIDGSHARCMSVLQEFVDVAYCGRMVLF